jgi:hypothetical protein
MTGVPAASISRTGPAIPSELIAPTRTASAPEFLQFSSWLIWLLSLS